MPTVSDLTAATLRLKRDDGALAYLNGVERARAGLTGVVDGTGLAAAAADDGKTFLSFTLPPAAFQAGKNTVAVELHQSAPNSSDASFDADLTITRTTTGPTGVPINANTWLRARTRNGTVWSALDEAFFQVDPLPVAPGDVVVSELNYHPNGVGREEFVELQNISPRAVNLRGCRFSEGFTYVFSDTQDVLLAPGQRMVLVEDFPGFQEKYGLGVAVAGRYFGSLANEGEMLALTAANGDALFRLAYADATPWPAGADGAGSTLVRRDNNAAGAAGWRLSAQDGGSPGGKDTVPFTGNPDADADGDGLTAWAEYALGTSDADASAGSGALQASAAANGTLNVSFHRSLRAEDVSYLIETSVTLASWSAPAIPPVLLSQMENADGTATETWEVAVSPAPAGTFARLRLSRP